MRCRRDSRSYHDGGTDGAFVTGSRDILPQRASADDIVTTGRQVFAGPDPLGDVEGDRLKHLGRSGSLARRRAVDNVLSASANCTEIRIVVRTSLCIPTLTLTIWGRRDKECRE